MEVSAMNCHHRFYTLEDFFKSAHENGFRNVELWSGPMHFYLDYQQYDDIQILKELEKKYDIKIIGVCPEQTNPKPNNMAAKHEDEQKRVYHYFKNAIDIAHFLNAHQVVVTSGWAYLSENLEEARTRSAQMMRKLAEYAQIQGIPLAIEALQPRESLLVNTISDLKDYLELVNHENLKICLDLGAMAKANETIKDYFETFGSRIIHCHFVDGNPVGHMAWGDGNRNMCEDLDILHQYDYQGYLSFEIVNQMYYQQPHLADQKCIELFNQWRPK
ncbi:endonuclease [Massilimicrobiota sp. An142]|nr:endonuclease [Massilimicrobiota sp. An80]OUQ07863.1 endonuclease [Massilimicrobiota sp. An142]OUQ73629.1 endonuclease [Massilimicrobiota sp. An105]